MKLFLVGSRLFKKLGLIGTQFNENTVMVWMKIADLVNIMPEHGIKVTL